MGRVIHFEIHADDPARAAQFYGAVFGWKLQHIPQLDYWMIETGEGAGINGGMLRRKGAPPAKGQPVNSFICTIGVDDVDAAVSSALAAGAAIAMPKGAIPGVGWLAYIIDPEGNIVGVHKADSAAA